MNIPVDIMFYVFFAVGIMRLFSFKRLLGTFIGASIAFGAVAYSTSAKAENLMGTCNDDTRVVLKFEDIKGTQKVDNNNFIENFFKSVFPFDNENNKPQFEIMKKRVVHVGFCADYKAKKIWWGQDEDELLENEKQQAFDTMHQIAKLGQKHKHSKFVTLPNGQKVAPLPLGWEVANHNGGAVIMAKLDTGEPMQLIRAAKIQKRVPVSVVAKANHARQIYARNHFKADKKMEAYRALTIHKHPLGLAHMNQAPLRTAINITHSFGYHYTPA